MPGPKRKYTDVGEFIPPPKPELPRSRIARADAKRLAKADALLGAFLRVPKFRCVVCGQHRHRPTFPGQVICGFCVRQARGLTQYCRCGECGRGVLFRKGRRPPARCLDCGGRGGHRGVVPRVCGASFRWAQGDDGQNPGNEDALRAWEDMG